MEWILLKNNILPENGQIVDIWISKNGKKYRGTDFVFYESDSFHKIPVFKNKDIGEICYFLEDGFVTHYMIVEAPKKEIKKLQTCHCGKPIDQTNPDCVEFSLCEDCALDA